MHHQGVDDHVEAAFNGNSCLPPIRSAALSMTPYIAPVEVLGSSVPDSASSAEHRIAS
ncbi:MAG: hypothetical protein ABGZ53_05050 [Fuerstiella sp.]